MWHNTQNLPQASVAARGAEERPSARVTKPERERIKQVGGHTKVNDELCDLESGDPFFPPDADASRSLEVIPVHNDMYSQIQGDRYPRHWGLPNQLGITKKCRCSMVIAVQERWQRQRSSDS